MPSSRGRGAAAFCFLYLALNPFAFRLLLLILADDDDRNILRALVPYPPLYPIFRERHDSFRRGEQADLPAPARSGAGHLQDWNLRYGAKLRSQKSVDVVAFGREDVVTSVPSETPVNNKQPPNGTRRSIDNGGRISTALLFLASGPALI